MIQHARARGPSRRVGSWPVTVKIGAARHAQKKQTACKVQHIPLHYCALSAPLTPMRVDGRLRRG
jgi:hypothetical protein